MATTIAWTVAVGFGLVVLDLYIRLQHSRHRLRVLKETASKIWNEYMTPEQRVAVRDDILRDCDVDVFDPRSPAQQRADMERRRPRGFTVTPDEARRLNASGGGFGDEPAHVRRAHSPTEREEGRNN